MALRCLVDSHIGIKCSSRIRTHHELRAVSQAARQSRSDAEVRELRAHVRKAQRDGTKAGSTKKKQKRQWISVVRGGLAGGK